MPLTIGVGDEWIEEVIQRVQPFTMTSRERIYGLCLAVEHVVRSKVPGSFVECGVWRGGSAMAIALSLQHAGVNDRELVMFDTYQGMTEPTDGDRDLEGNLASDLLQEADRETSLVWAKSQLDEVQENISSVGYANVSYVVGDVLETVPAQAPETIALLRLDTDWYESTRHEMTHLLPRVARGGILIVDDYGHWSGARRAVDEYVDEHGLDLFLCPLDYTGRLAVIS